MPGPVPKRSDQRRRRNKPASGEVVSIVPSSPEDGVVDAPEADESWHPLMRDWFNSLKESGQAIFYEPSDWQTARIAAAVMSDGLNSGELKATTLKEFNSMADSLMTTEGERRRLRVELQRGSEPSADDESVSVMADYKEMFS